MGVNSVADTVCRMRVASCEETDIDIHYSVAKAIQDAAIKLCSSKGSGDQGIRGGETRIEPKIYIQAITEI